jgi:AraC family transcriptional regulator
MKWTPRIETLKAKKLVGKRLSMSLAENRTVELWKSFMPRRHEIKNKISEDLISMQVYDVGYSFEQINFTAPFDKWASKEVLTFDNVPEEMEMFMLESGLYAVFEYKGLNTDTSIFQYIFGEWLPQSEYMVDNRPHFEILGAKYKNNDAESEEEIWIPIKMK